MTNKEKKIIKYIEGMSEALGVLANEVKKEGFTKEKEQLMSDIGSGLLVTAKSFTYRT